MIQPEDLQIDRIIIHKVHGKEDEQDYGFAEYSEELFDFGATELQALKKRISTAFSRKKRFFKLEIAKIDSDSFFDNAKNLKGTSTGDFIQYSKNIADLLASSHDRKTIPSGILLIMDGTYKSKYFVLVIKAELQEAFTITELEDHKMVELISELFLSPAKDFYKIGYILEDKNEATYPNSEYSAYMYDDNFSSGNRDLAEYFYNKFLGFATNKNDKLLTRNFRNDLFSFIDNNVRGFDDVQGLKRAVNSFYRENTTGVINPQEFAEENFEGELLRKYGSEVGVNYPHSFTKDLSLVDRNLQRGKILLVDDLKIEGPFESINKIKVLSAENFDPNKLLMDLENGDLKQIITVSTNNN